MCRINLWQFGSDCLPSTLQFSVCSQLIQLSSSSWFWATLPLVPRATVTVLGRVLASVAFSLASNANEPLTRVLGGAYIYIKCTSLQSVGL
jgi:hypothetical protein